MPHLLKRLRPHGLIRKVGRIFRNYLIRFGKQVITTGMKLRKFLVIPYLTALMRHNSAATCPMCAVFQ